MANNLPGLHPAHNVPTWVFNGSSVSLASAHEHGFAAEYRQQMVSKEEPWPGQVQPGSLMAMSTPPTVLNVLKAPALPWHCRAARTILKSLFLRAGRSGGRRKTPSAQPAPVMAHRHVWQQAVRQPLEHREPFLHGAKHQGPIWLPTAHPAVPATAVRPA